MKRHPGLSSLGLTSLGLSSLLGSGVAIVMAAQPLAAAVTQVTGVQVNQAGGGVRVVLQTRNGDRPNIFTVNRGNSLTADIINTELRLPQGNGFLQNNPAPGISSIVVSQLDANSIRVTVNGETSPPTSQVAQSPNGIVFTLNAPSTTAQANPPAPTAPAPAPAPTQAAPAPRPPATPTPDILVPNPQISIDGVPTTGTAPGAVPPLQPRAIAPPVGDIAISNLDTSPSEIDLGTGERVPRLVLRDAPVRDVLSLLARAAGLNIAYIGEAQGAGSIPGQPPAAGGVPGQAASEIRVSLDVENEPVQNVFNYVLRIADLEANRTGRTIFVGPRLPDDARSVVSRTLRMNQVPVTDAANFLTAQGAETQIPIERIEITTVGEGAAARTIESRTPEILALRATEGNGPLLLRGLSVLTNNRLNSITLVGAPRKVEIATALLSQLDLRQRQVAVNVKIVDINLLATEGANTSFSFGIGDSFFSSDGGAATFNFGGVNPPSRTQVGNSQISPPIIPAPFPQGTTNEPFLDAQPNAPFGTGQPQPFGSPPLNDGTIQAPGSVATRPPFGTNDNPFQPGVTDIDENDITFGLPTLFQFPTRFLAALQAQVTSGNAKILTDPTLVVQEGQTASVQLTQQVYGGIRGTGPGEFEPIINNAGLTLNLQVSRIDDNGFVTLRVQPVVSVPGATAEAPSGQGQITLLQQRALDSGFIRLRDGQTLILSGIIQDSDRTTVSKIPILGDLPIIGALFRSTNRINNRAEVVVLLTPQVLDDSDVSNFGYSYTPSRDVQQMLRR